MNIASSAQFSLSADFDRTYPRGVNIGSRTYVGKGAVVLTHDRTRGLYLNTMIGSDCFIGVGAIILPGVTIGDRVIVGAGSVVTRSFPNDCIVAGNPARILRLTNAIGSYGRLATADETEAKLATFTKD